MTVIEMIRLISEESRNKTDEEIEPWIEFVSPMVSKKQFGKLYNQALAYLVCHKMMLAGVGQDGSASADDGSLSSFASMSSTMGFSIKSISEAGNSITFADRGASMTSGGSSKADADLTMTPYGMQYLALKNMVIVPIVVSGEDTF